jgi:hypothetical protein
MTLAAALDLHAFTSINFWRLESTVIVKEVNHFLLLESYQIPQRQFYYRRL